MSHRERTLQQLDPLGALSARPVTIVSAVSIVGYSVALTVLSRPEIDYPILAGLALVAVVLAAISLVYWSSPLRAPLRFSLHALVVGLVLAALSLSALSTWHSNRYLQDDWGSAVVGLAVLALAPYRPVRELWLSGVFCAIYVGFFALLQSHSLAAPVPAIVYVAVATTPILAFAFGAATFAGVVLRRFDRWQTRAEIAVQGLRGTYEDGIARSVQQDRVTILNRDIVPFIGEILDSGEITQSDRERARSISDAIRSVMVAEVDRSWLDGVVDQAGGRVLAARGGGVALIRDEERLARFMSTDQRTALRALLVAIISHHAFDPESFDIVIERWGEQCEGILHARIAGPTGAVKAELSPYFAVMRVVFLSLDVEVRQGGATLRFVYDSD